MPVDMKLVRVVTNQSRLMSSRPEQAGFWGRLQAALSDWETQLAHQNLRLELVRTDELAGGGRCEEAQRIRRHLADLRKQKEADYTLILGGDEIVPFYRLPDPVTELIPEADYWAKENDRLIYSDDPYVSDDDLLFRPKQPIGRFPNGDGQDNDLVIELLERSTRYHQHGGDTVCRLAFTTQSWQWQSRATWPLASYWYVCPPWRLPRTPYDPAPACPVSSEVLVGKTLHYYNLHGQKNGDWLGECECEWLSDPGENTMSFAPCQPPALSVAQVPVLPPAIVFSSACYGGFTTRPRPMQNLALCFLRQGAIAFIGATARSYTVGPLPGEDEIGSLRYSDRLAQTFFELVERNQATGPGQRIGEIVQTIKNDYHLTYRFFQHPLDFKTLWEVILYGDPTLIPFRQMNLQEGVYETDGQQSE